MVSYESVYTSAGINKASAVASSCPVSGLVAVGAGSQVCLWDSDDSRESGIHTVLPGHKADVTALHFVQPVDNVNPVSLLVSSDAAGSFKVWRRNHAHEAGWDCSITMSAHKGAVSALAVSALSSTEVCVVTGASDAAINIYRYLGDSDECTLQQTLSTGSKLPLGLGLARTPQRDPDLVLALAATDKKIQLYTSSLQNPFAFAASVALEGHTDWIRTLSFSQPLPGSKDVLLASGGQDNYIRLWRLKALPEGATKPQLDDLDLLDENSDEVAIRAKFFTPQSSATMYSVEPESVLLGHEAWAVSLHWSSELFGDLPKLASASADRSLIIWAYSETTSLWLNEYRLGELGGPAGLGFFGALWGKESRSIMAHDWTGSMHLWKRSDDGSAWTPGVGMTGHYKEAMDLQWQPQGKWLLSASLDKTTRLHAPWRRPAEDGQQIETWHELSRPQIHGHDVYALAITDHEQGLRFASGADETIVRLFDAPKTFVDLANSLSSASLSDTGDRPNAAIVPPLGLSNRAVSAEEKAPEPEEGLPLPLTAPEVHRPPIEEALQSTTLWPEVDKFYGHGYELRALATSHDGQFLASACRSTNPVHAAVHLRSKPDWRRTGEPLIGHTLSVHRIRFSPDDTYILTVGRDRSWHVYKRNEPGSKQPYADCSSQEKAHSRLIFDGCWLSETSFATVARDKHIKVWTKTHAADSWSETASVPLDAPPTAIDSVRVGDRCFVAVGTENGSLQMYEMSNDTLTELSSIPSHLAHNRQVTRLAFAPPGGSNGPTLRLASCSEDRLVRILDVTA